ncbi:MULTISPECIES: hypothetical protein [unclassified Streptomyces]|uniref:hypothetical protein n=1 Tax=unclassified Streptomyces TaxID=2593676 RepID=UPI002E15464B|nr:hypothetical protein OG452_19320 [Streptomyces sp. NBC_01197]WSS50002.1 hypothetical protein OG708_15935 [Streptomyces sp. NBC_01180]
MTETDTQLTATAMLETAHKAVAQGFPCDDRLARAALHLIECAADVVERLPRADRDVDSAREALGHARAAVVTATFAVRQIHDESGRGLVQESGSVQRPGRVVCGLDR